MRFNFLLPLLAFASLSTAHTWDQEKELTDSGKLGYIIHDMGEHNADWGTDKSKWAGYWKQLLMEKAKTDNVPLQDGAGLIVTEMKYGTKAPKGYTGGWDFMVNGQVKWTSSSEIKKPQMVATLNKWIGDAVNADETFKPTV